VKPLSTQRAKEATQITSFINPETKSDKEIPDARMRLRMKVFLESSHHVCTIFFHVDSSSTAAFRKSIDLSGPIALAVELSLSVGRLILLWLAMLSWRSNGGQ